MSTDGMRSVDPCEHKSTTSGAGDMTLALVPQTPTRTMVRLTNFDDGSLVLVDPFDVIKVDTYNGRTLVVQRAPAGTTAVRETPTEVNNLLARAGVRIIGADDVSYAAFVAAMSPNAAAFVTDTGMCTDCEFELSKCTCSDVPHPPPAPAPGKGAR